MTNKALGKGLSALIPEKVQEIKEENIAILDINLIRDSSVQPRTNYDQAKLDELKVSIKEKGVLQPILVRKKGDVYEVVAGERRLRASRQLNLEHIPVVVKNVSDKEAFVMALVENIQREELNPIEEAEAFKKLIEEFEYTQEQVAQSVGKDRSTITNLLRLLKLPEDIKKSVYQGELSAGHARALLAVESFIERSNLYKKVLKNKLSVRELENLITHTRAPRQEIKTKPKDQQIIQLEDSLQKLLGTKVSVQAKKKRGKIVIEYYSISDLDRIVKLFIK